MINLNSDEKIILLIRRHWWILVSPALAIFFLLLLPALVLLFAPSLFSTFAIPALGAFLVTLYFLFLLLFALLIWTNYYLDVWIITNERIIDIEQLNLFSRTISEFPINRVQDISIDIHGIIETFLKFGDLRVQTAGYPGGFTIKDAPNLYEAKDAILKFSNHHSTSGV